MSKLKLNHAELVHQHDLIASPMSQRVDVVIQRVLGKTSGPQHIADRLQLFLGRGRRIRKMHHDRLPLRVFVAQLSGSIRCRCILLHTVGQLGGQRGRSTQQTEQEKVTGGTKVGTHGRTSRDDSISSSPVLPPVKSYGVGDTATGLPATGAATGATPGCTIIAIRGKLKLPPASSITFTWHTYVPGFNCVSGTSN